MNNFLQANTSEKISCFDHAVFYCINESSQKMPVAVVTNFSFLPDNRLEFVSSNFPVLEESWNVFAAELHFYKKGLSFNLTVHGTAWFTNQTDLTVQFKVLHTEHAGYTESKSISFQNSIYELLSSTGVFFKKMLVTGF